MSIQTAASRIILGTAQFGLTYGITNNGLTPTKEECADIITLARNAGINRLDTAIAYGSSETLLGQIGITDMQVITKLPPVPEDHPSVEEWVHTQVVQSLARLQKARIDGLLLHRPAQLSTPMGPALYDSLRRIQICGLATHIGVSIYSPEELLLIPEHMRFDIVQAPINVIDQRMITSGWARRLKDQGVEVHARSIFLQGLLLMRGDHRPAQFQRWHSLWQAWDNWLSSSGLSALQTCLRFALTMPWVDKLVIGVNSPQHLTEIIQATNGSLPPLPHCLHCTDPELLNPALWSPK